MSETLFAAIAWLVGALIFGLSFHQRWREWVRWGRTGCGPKMSPAGQRLFAVLVAVLGTGFLVPKQQVVIQWGLSAVYIVILVATGCVAWRDNRHSRRTSPED